MELRLLLGTVNTHCVENFFTVHIFEQVALALRKKELP